MTELSDILSRHGFDASTLDALYDLDDATIYQIVVDGEAAVDTWHKLRAIVGETGRWPALLGQIGGVNAPGIFAPELLHMVHGSGIPLPRANLERAAAVDAGRWFAEHALPDCEDDDWSEYGLELGVEVSPGEPSHEFTIPYDVVTREAFSHVSIGLFPTPHSWEVPAWLCFGGWNGSPEPHEHVAIFAHWRERYGAEILGVTRDVIEAYVERPPGDLEAATVLAREQYSYCTDVIDQGTMTTERLARTLQGGTAWYFWWD
jgi:hypothetical protein